MPNLLAQVIASNAFQSLDIPIYAGFNETANYKTGPFISLENYHQEKQYDSGGAVGRKVAFDIHIVAKNLETAMDAADAVESVVDWVSLVDRSQPARQLSYDSIDIAENETYTSHVVMRYEFWQQLR